MAHSKLVLGGFSQGAMTAVDVALSMPADKRVAGVLSTAAEYIMLDHFSALATPTRAVCSALLGARV